MLSFAASPTWVPGQQQTIRRCNFPSYPRTCRQYTYARIVPLPTGVNIEVIDIPNPEAPKVSADENTQNASDKPPLIFIHGSLHAAWCYRFFQPFFARHGFQTHAVSLRGSAGSPLEEGSRPPTVADHVADLSSLMPKLKLARAPIIIAHSIGGFVAQKWVEQDSTLDAFRMILLSSTPPSGNKNIVWRVLFRKGIGLAMRITMAFVKRTVTTKLEVCREMFFSSKDSPGFREEIEGDETLLDYMKLLQRSGTTCDFNSLKKVVTKTGKMRGKVLVLGGLLDNLVDRDALEESARFWDADLRIVEDAPHDVMLYSRWEDIANYLLEWITASLEQNSSSLQVQIH